MKFDELVKGISESNITPQQFTDALGDEDDILKVKADLKKKQFEALMVKIPELWKEYVAEAEHQDGYGFWENFKNTDDIIDDFMFYVKDKGYRSETY